MKTNTNSFRKISRAVMLGAVLAVGLLRPLVASAGAVATDSRNGASGVGRPWDGDAARQLYLATDRAVRNGGTPAYIRTAQFTAPRGALCYYYVAYVDGKGWCGNWAYDMRDLNVASLKAIDGLAQQKGVRIQTLKFVAYWQE